MKRLKQPWFYPLIFGILGVSIGLLLFQVSWLSLGLGGLFSVIGWGYHQFEEQVSQETLRHDLKVAMMESFALLNVLIAQGMTPYQALNVLLTFVPRPLADRFHQFLIEIDQDASLQPFLAFGQAFQSLMIDQLLFSLYQLHSQGGQVQALNHFRYLFDQADHQHHASRMHTFHEKMQSAANYVMVATGLIAFSLLIGVMQLIGGMIYG